MDISEFGEYKFTASSQYEHNEKNYIVAVKEDSSFSNKNIIPLYYITENKEVLGIDENEIGDRIFVINSQRDYLTEDIGTRFYTNELFKIFRGPLAYNDRHEADHNIPKTKIYKNYLQELAPNEVIEVFSATIDISKSRLDIQEPTLKELLNKTYIKNGQSLFVLSTDQIVGPFTLISSDNEGFFVAEKSQLCKFGIYQINRDDYIEVYANKILRRIITNLSDLEKSFKCEFDFINDKDLIAWFDTEIMRKKNGLFNKNELSIAIEQIDRANNSIDIIESKERYDRIYNILSNTKDTLISKQSILNALPEFQVIKEELESFEKKRLDIKNDIENRNKELENLVLQLSAKEKEKNHLGQLLKELKEQEEAEQNKIRENISSEIAILEKRKSEIDSEIELERSQKSKTLEDLKMEIDFRERRKNELETGIDTLKREFTSEQRKAQEKLSELVKQNTHFTFISGRDLPSDSVEKALFEDYSVENTITDYSQLRKRVSEILRNQQRHFEDHFIDNLLICIHHNTLTLFAGLPGTGKTSLAKILTEALVSLKRTREISVGRGWTSQKDLIGFANPLSKKFHESQTGFYGLLRQLSYEWENERYFNTPLAYVILDEANLSPIEHYWSTFYNMTDIRASKDKPLTINLGESELIRHANVLRFIGTINYDQTTEDLSPRILDRTNIIRLMPKQFQADVLSQNEIDSLNISFSEIIKLFELNDFATEQEQIRMPESLNSKYNDIKEIFNKLNVYISPRVDIAINRYCKLASKLMTEESRPLDYCIAQRLLPLINIQGNKKAELEQLKKLILSFNLDDSVSLSILSNIIEIGSRTGYTQDNYNYFLTLTNV